MKTKCNLIVKLFQDPNSTSPFRILYLNNTQGCSNLGDMDYNDTVSAVQVWKGPDYVNGDVARLFNGVNFDPVNGYIDLEPRTSMYMIHKHPYNFNDAVSSVKLLNKITETNAVWPEPIYCIVELYDLPLFQGKKRILFNSVPDIAVLGFDNRISSARILAGPAYSATDGFVNFYDMKNYQSMMMPANKRPASENQPLEIKDFGNFTNKVTSIQITKVTVKLAVPV